jgi:hypothetical protein
MNRTSVTHEVFNIRIYLNTKSEPHNFAGPTLSKVQIPLASLNRTNFDDYLCLKVP